MRWHWPAFALALHFSGILKAEKADAGGSVYLLYKIKAYRFFVRLLLCTIGKIMPACMKIDFYKMPA